MSNYQLQLRSVYNIQMKAGAILGYSYKNATVMGLLDFQSANQIADVTPIHTSVYSQLGPGVPRKASDLTYVKLKTNTGQIAVIAMDWIAEEPVLVTSHTIKVILSEVNLSDLGRLRDVLVANGFDKADISVVDNPEDV